MLNVLEIILLDIKYLTINVVINQFDHIQMVNDQLMLTSIILFFFFSCSMFDCGLHSLCHKVVLFSK